MNVLGSKVLHNSFDFLSDVSAEASPLLVMTSDTLSDNCLLVVNGDMQNVGFTDLYGVKDEKLERSYQLKKATSCIEFRFAIDQGLNYPEPHRNSNGVDSKSLKLVNV